MTIKFTAKFPPQVGKPYGGVAFTDQGVRGNARQRRLIVRRWKKQRVFIIERHTMSTGQLKLI